jgi:hypothetical protein
MEKWLSGRSEEQRDDKTGREANRNKRKRRPRFIQKKVVIPETT